MRLAFIGLILALPVQAFELKKDREGDVVRWTSAIHFAIDPKLDQKLHAPGATQAVKAAVATWAAALPHLQLTAEAGPLDAASSTVTVVDEDWPYDDKVMGVAILKVDYRNNRIVAADIKFNAAQNRFKVLPADSHRGGDFADVQNTVTHELGHALGLQHESDVVEAVMFPLAYAGEVNKRVLSSDEFEGLGVLYPEVPAGPQDVGCSSTGSGASLALGLALLVAARLRQPRAPQLVRCVPTRGRART